MGRGVIIGCFDLAGIPFTFDNGSVIDPSLSHFLHVQEPFIPDRAVNCNDLTSRYWVSFFPTHMFGVNRAVNVSFIH
jgi:hypothetical protein